MAGDFASSEKNDLVIQRKISCRNLHLKRAPLHACSFISFSYPFVKEGGKREGRRGYFHIDASSQHVT